LLRQALINVLQNAVKYSPEGGKISVVVAKGSSDRATVTISDSGPGIPVEHRARIFDRFYRVDDARTRETGGAGLGLAIANWAVQAQGGRILVEDSSEGATFSIDLPRST
jgi:signal transduction histidine kinase